MRLATYEVVSGDNLSTIGAQLGISWRQIAALNGIEKPYQIYPNDELLLPVVESEVSFGAVRYVTVDGKGDGLSWESGMGSVAAAVQSLPSNGFGSQRRREGTVITTSGIFDETEPIEANYGLTFLGAGSGDLGTVIRRAHDGPLFKTTFGDWNHHLIFRGLRLDGNKANFPAVADLLQLGPGGFSTALYDVLLKNASGHGVSLTHAVNLYLYNCSGAGCDAGWLRLNLYQSANLANLGIYGAQVDDCGPAVIHIEDRSDGDANNIMVYGLETEATRPGVHESVIRVDTIGGASPTWLTIDGVSAWRSGQAGKGDAVCLRTGTGTTPRWAFRNVHGSGYARAFKDETNGAESVGKWPNHLVHAVYSTGESDIGPSDA